MPVNTKNLKRDAAQIPVPQYFDADLDDFVPLDNGMYIKESQVMIPTEMQSKYTESEQAISTATIPTNSWKQSDWKPTNGFDKLFASVNMTGGTGMTVTIDFSFDGSTQSNSMTIYDGTATSIFLAQEVGAPYYRLSVKNKDTVNPKTTTGWIYKKL